MKSGFIKTVMTLAAILLGSVTANAAEKVKVLASFSILADIVREVGGDRVDVTSLVGANSDAHTFQPSPAHQKQLLASDIFVINGLGFEGWADKFVKASGYKGVRLVATKGVKAIKGDSHQGHSHGHNDHASAYDPHAWQDVANVKIYVTNIRDALSKIDAAGAGNYEANAQKYMATLSQLDNEIKAGFAGLSTSQRRVITSHDSFGYFGEAYDIDFIPLQGRSTESEVTAKDMAKLIDQIKKEKIQAVFLENVSDGRLVSQISRETGAKVGGSLYSDALSGREGGAASYVAMMRYNAKTLVEAMK